MIKVGYLISYDYEFVKTSLPRVYDSVAEIYFAVDKDRKTWSGQDFEIKEPFWDWVREFDTLNKITIYEDSFYVPGLSPMECDTRERNLLSKRMGEADWYVQIDSDEYFLDFKAFAERLLNFNPADPTSVYCHVATLFKKVESGYFLIRDSIETLSFATNNPVYDLARNNESGNKHVVWDDLVLHQSWAREPEEIRLKLSNWSHKNDFNTKSFYKLWDAIDEHNYYGVSNFHPLYPPTWPGLIFFSGSIQKILESASAAELRGGGHKPVKKKPLLSRLWKEIRA
jgi:hypothetical protein